MKNPENNSQAPKKSASAKLLSKWWLLVPVVVFSLALPYLPQLYFFVKHYKGPEVGDVPHDLYVTKRLSGVGSIASWMHWLDNERVFYWGYDTLAPPRSIKSQDKLVSQGKNLFLWEFKELSKVYPDKGWDQSAAFCAGEGNVQYSAGMNLENGVNYQYFGPVLQEEKENIFPLSSAIKEFGLGSLKRLESNCELIVNSKNKELDRFWHPFARGDEYLLFGGHSDAGRQYEFLDIYSPSIGKFTRVDIQSANVRYTCTRYNPFLKGLMVWNCGVFGPQDSQSEWARSGCRAIWAVWPNGETKKYCLPYGEWAKHSSDIIPVVTKKGLFFFWAGGPASYLVDESNQATLIRRGLFQKPSVSPDGCKVAGNYAKGWVDARWIVGRGGQHAAVIDLCPSSKNDSEVR